MNILNIEIKARCRNPEQIENILLEEKARFVGTDHQIDTYFHTNDGRLKLREGKIETSLIQYNRIEKKGLKKSEVLLYKPQGDVTILKDILERNLGVKTIVDKKRKIFFIENVKFHLDNVIGLGEFVEIEAIDEYLQLSEDQLNAQCLKYIKLFKIREGDFIDKSYSDMIMEQKKSGK